MMVRKALAFKQVYTTWTLQEQECMRRQSGSSRRVTVEISWLCGVLEFSCMILWLETFHSRVIKLSVVVVFTSPSTSLHNVSIWSGAVCRCVLVIEFCFNMSRTIPGSHMTHQFLTTTMIQEEKKLNFINHGSMTPVFSQDPVFIKNQSTSDPRTVSTTAPTTPAAWSMMRSRLLLRTATCQAWFKHITTRRYLNTSISTSTTTWSHSQPANTNSKLSL